MESKYKNKYRIPSARLQSWNYAASAAYFITICTQDRVHYFGEVRNKEMHLNEIGKLAEQEWLNTIELRPDMNLELGQFVVMPNHFHGIVIIGDNEYNRNNDLSIIETLQSIRTNKISVNSFGPQSKNLSAIIRGFKGTVTKNARVINPEFKWQERFHDNIIRDGKAFDNIQNYIYNNPNNWKEDTFYKN